MAEALWARLTSGQGVVHVSWRIGDFFEYSFFLSLFYSFSLCIICLVLKGWEVIILLFFFLNMELMRRCILIDLRGERIANLGIISWEPVRGRSCTIRYNVLLLYSFFFIIIICCLYYHLNYHTNWHNIHKSKIEIRDLHCCTASLITISLSCMDIWSILPTF